MEAQTKTRVQHAMICICCRNVFNISFAVEDYIDWKQGKHIQNAFPYLNAGNRELIQSGTCSSCFDELFPEEDDRDPSDDNHLEQ